MNAVYFKASWVHKFDGSEKKKFHVSDRHDVEVDMMYLTQPLSIAILPGAGTMLELPYKGDRIVMQILLPDGRFK